MNQMHAVESNQHYIIRRAFCTPRLGLVTESWLTLSPPPAFFCALHFCFMTQCRLTHAFTCVTLFCAAGMMGTLSREC
jgi:hypothetical protein